MEMRWTVVGASIIVLLMVPIAIFAMGTDDRPPSGERLYINIVIDDVDIRVGERFKARVDGAPEGSVVSWNMGDSSLLEGREVEHSYSSSDVHSISVEVVKGRSTGYANVTVPVRCMDFKRTLSGDPIFYFTSVRKYSCLEIDLPRSITCPNFTIDVWIEGGTGEFEVFQELDSGTSTSTYGHDSLNGFRETLIYHYQLSPSEYACEHPGPIMLSTIIDGSQGTYQDAGIEVLVSY